MKLGFKSERGQTSTEYMLLISVVVVAVTAAAYTFVPGFASGVRELGKDVSVILHDGSFGGVGLPRGTSNGNAPDVGPAADPNRNAPATGFGSGSSVVHDPRLVCRPGDNC